ncbi:23S rRNA pseudouridine(1911/1915/1917) synthase RluD [Gallaecimonas kandeliae]|uniref:23S rRNA pseudouridine(1911/1915/1917) synthase RluD n=1 Tax=Gallaecimonas kandeliae TaxID=3029055 RepID=UPI0026475C83|nr:23S rRNA pseudouridine(1911/1915/1917) synthase RluD [Gallaecimonas kandeliae]WKE64946.1 23S rRNA pseudouridine(1911/1915/1917) synthase RluD [Gallaecimonas kandeliae]
MREVIELSAKAGVEHLGQRLDQVLADLFPDHSRSRLKEWILAGHVTVDGQVVDKPRQKLMGMEAIEVQAEVEADERFKAEAIDLDIVYEDEHILVINKAAGLVVHPGAGNADGTLLNALLHHCPEIAIVPRAGIVHRLDKDTTGLMVVAKTLAAQTHLVEKLQARDITREYEALAIGVMTAGGTVDAPIGRHPTKRTHMAVVRDGKPAVTHYRVAEKFRLHTRLRLRLESGRTHQIRVHMAHIGHPLVGDPLYGGRSRLLKGADPDTQEILRQFPRQALHAAKLILEHPVTGEEMCWEAPIPDDMLGLYDLLRDDMARHGG